MNKVIKFLCLNALLIGSASFGMNVAPQGIELRQAADNGNLLLVHRLLDEGAYVNARSIWHETPLMCAAHFGHEKICQLLLDRNAQIDATDCNAETALLHAAYGKHKKTCLMLIDTTLKPIKSKINAIIVFLGIKKRCGYMKLIDREIMKLIAHQLYEPVTREKQKLFAQINIIPKKKLKKQLRKYARKQLKAPEKQIDGDSHE